MSQNESVVTRWLERQPEPPPSWRDRAWAILSRLALQCRAAKIEAARRFARLATNRAVAAVLRAPARWAAGATASLSGMVMAIWMTFFPGAPVEPQPAPTEFTCLAEVASSEIAPACEDSPSTSKTPFSETNEPGVLIVPNPESISGRPSPFYSVADANRADRADVEHADHEEPAGTDGFRFPPVEQVEFDNAESCPPVWLSGTIEVVEDGPSASLFGDSTTVEDAILRMPPALPPTENRRVSDPRPRPRWDESGPALVIQPR